MNKLFTHAQTRRQTLKKLAAGETLASFSLAGFPLESRYAQAYPADPIKIGFPVHRTGIGAANGLLI